MPRVPRSHGIAPRIARYGIESRERLGNWRWVIERTLDWLHRFRRLRIRYERQADAHEALLSHACILICWRYIQRFCSAFLAGLSLFGVAFVALCEGELSCSSAFATSPHQSEKDPW